MAVCVVTQFTWHHHPNYLGCAILWLCHCALYCEVRILGGERGRVAACDMRARGRYLLWGRSRQYFGKESGCILALLQIICGEKKQNCIHSRKKMNYHLPVKSLDLLREHTGQSFICAYYTACAYTFRFLESMFKGKVHLIGNHS